VFRDTATTVSRNCNSATDKKEKQDQNQGYLRYCSKSIAGDPGSKLNPFVAFKVNRSFACSFVKKKGRVKGHLKGQP